MRTGEIVDLGNERRLSAVLDFTPSGGELLILNGGSRAEELVVITTSYAPIRSERRSAYCIDSGTSMQLNVPLEPAVGADDVTLRIVSSHGEMLLAAPSRAKRLAFGTVRGWSTGVAVTLLLLLAGGRLDSPSMYASADPEPAPVDAPLIRPSVSLQVPTRLPNVVARPATPSRHVPLLPPARPSLEERAVVAAIVSPALVPVIKRAALPQKPAPRMTDLRVPTTAKSGDFVPVSFGAIARQVKIVASIGPTIVSKTIIGAQHGVIAIRSPKSDLDSRIMTVRAYAQDGNRTSTLQAMVVLIRP